MPTCIWRINMRKGSCVNTAPYMFVQGRIRESTDVLAISKLCEINTSQNDKTCFSLQRPNEAGLIIMIKILCVFQLHLNRGFFFNNPP